MTVLKGVGIVIANVAEHSSQEVERLALSLGATLLRPENANAAKYLVANSVLRLRDRSDPYGVAVERNPRLIIVTTSWLLQCHNEQRQVPPTDYVLLPLAGVRASITNFGAKDRPGIMDQLSSGGAQPSPELLRQMTHLICNKAGGNKFTHATEWGLFVVHHDWLLDSLEKGYRMDESRYDLRPARPAPGGSVSQLSNGPVSSERCVSEQGPVTSTGTAAGAAAARQGPATINGVVAPVPGAVAAGAAAGVPAAGGVSRGGSGTLQPANCPAPGGMRDPPPQQQQPQQQAPGCPANQYYAVPAVPPDDCYFLHWVRLWLVGCTPSEMSHVLAAVRESGATREPVLSSDVTHIVFGSVLSTADLGAVQRHLGEHREQVKLVRLNWLYECVNRRAYVEPEGPYTVTLAQLLGHGGAAAGALGPSQAIRGAGPRSREPSPAVHMAAQVGAAGPAVGGQTVPAGGGPIAAAGGRGVAPMDDYVPLEPEANTRTADGLPSRAEGPVFNGLWFTLVAVAGTPEENTATKLIRQGGGMIMSASTEKDVRDPSRRFAVCPFSLPPSAVTRLCARGRDRTPSEFERVPQDQRVTTFWLSACLELHKLLKYDRMQTPLWRPVLQALPLPNTPGLVIAVSNYDEAQRVVLHELIKFMGADGVESFSKRCHYLVTSQAFGKKYECAVKWGIPCVNENWLIESLHAGRLEDPQSPAFAPQRLPVAGAEGRTMGHGGGSDGGNAPSQLGPTQRPTSTGAPQMPGAMAVRGAQGAALAEQAGRLPAWPSGLPPRPTQVADRTGGATQAAPPPPQQPRAGAAAPPPGPAAAAAHLAPDAARRKRRDPQAAPVKAPAETPRPHSGGMPPLIQAILDAENSETEAEDPPAGGAGGTSRQREGAAAVEPGPPASAPQQASGNPPYSSASAQAPGGSAADPRGTAGEPGAPIATGPGTGTAGPDTAGTHTSAAGAGGDPDTSQAAHPPPPAAAQEQRQAQALNAAQLEHSAAAASLMQFLSNNQPVVQEISFSQIEVGMPPPSLPHVAGLEGSMPTMEASRQPGTLKPPEAEAPAGAAAGRRSRKRNAAAAVGDVPGVPGKAGGLPGRRGRIAEEEEGLGVVMSQQVGYEEEMAALPPRTTRSSSRGRGGLGNDAKQNLIKAVQGNIR